VSIARTHDPVQPFRVIRSDEPLTGTIEATFVCL
jgi:hypothetical protein